MSRTIRHRRTLAGLIGAIVLMLLGSVTTVSAASTSEQRRGIQAAERDVMLVIDGSSSMSSYEWTMLLLGYSQAIADPKIVPRDGSVSIGVVQFSGDGPNGARVEIPLTRMTDAATVEAFRDELILIDQIGASTNPGDGIIKASDHLDANGRVGVRSRICVSPEGAPNTGVDLPTAWEHAQTAGIDTMGYVAIQDPPDFTEQEAHATYDNYVLGAGDVNVARNVYAFTEGALGCFLPALELGAIEVNQAVQDWHNSVPLIKDRDTIVRVFLTYHGGSAVKTTGNLRGYRNGEELPGSPIEAQNSPRTVTVDHQLTRGDRASLGGSLNFKVPKSWAHGQIKLVPELPGGLKCAPGDPRWTDDCGVEVGFQDTGTFRIKVYGGTYKQNGKKVELSHAELVEQLARVKDAFPVGDVVATFDNGFGLGKKPGPSRAVLIGLNNRLLNDWRFDRVFHGVDVRTKYHLVVPGVTSGPSGRSHGTPGHVATSWTMGKTSTHTIGGLRNGVAHEVMHMWGQPHATHEKFPAGSNGYKTGVCGQVSLPEAPNYPYWFTPPNKSKERPAIGPMSVGNLDEQIWGAVPRYFENGISGGALAIVSPYKIYSLMSYCGEAHGQGKWVGVDAYKSLAEHGFDTVPIRPRTDNHSAVQQSAVVTLGGLIYPSEQKVTFGDVLPAFGRPSTEDDPEGSYTLRLVDSAGTVLHQVGFDPRMALPTADSPPVGSFLISVPQVAEEVVRAELLHDSELIGTLSMGGNADEALRMENVAVSLSDYSKELTVDWEGGQGTGGFQPTYMVQYSPDDGGAWETIGAGLTETRMSISRWTLPGSQQARVRVIASYGLRTNAGTSSLLDIPAAVPQLTVTSPQDGQTFSGAQPIIFSASAYDAQDGTLSGEAITWRSDLDGQLGAGETLRTTADQLSAGVHNITASATASTGYVSSEHFTIEVQRAADLGS